MHPVMIEAGQLTKAGLFLLFVYAFGSDGVFLMSLNVCRTARRQKSQWQGYSVSMSERDPFVAN